MADPFEDALGVNCPSCGTPITANNAGGYLTYCLSCVRQIPQLPDVPLGASWTLTGKAPDFRWQTDDASDWYGPLVEKMTDD